MAAVTPVPGTEQTPVPLAALPSRNPPPDRLAERHPDPFWGGLWGYAQSAQWSSVQDQARLEKQGLAHAGAMRNKHTPEEAREKIATVKRPLGRARRLEALAAVEMFRTVLSERLVAVTGQASAA